MGRNMEGFLATIGWFLMIALAVFTTWASFGVWAALCLGSLFGGKIEIGERLFAVFLTLVAAGLWYVVMPTNF